MPTSVKASEVASVLEGFPQVYDNKLKIIHGLELPTSKTAELERKHNLTTYEYWYGIIEIFVGERGNEARMEILCDVLENSSYVNIAG